ncbi:MAG: hypothetical protein AB1324_07350 [Candidatus Micrarchaeota archaeon]
MRFFLLAVLLAAGCVSQPGPAANETSQPLPEPNDTLVIEGNITVPEPPQNATNVTLPPEDGTDNAIPANQTNETNITGSNETPAPEEQPPEDGSPNEVESQMPKGIIFGGGRFSLVLDDISVVPVSDEPCGIFSVRDAYSGEILDKMLICPGDSQNWAAPEGKIYRILVTKVAAGYTFEEKWAKVYIYG